MSFIEKYFINEEGEGFNPPATAQQIAALENELGLVLPQDYKTFLLTMNGYEGVIGESYVVFEPVERIVECTKESSTQFFPWTIYIGGNGGLEMFVMDTRTTPFSFGLLPSIGDENDFIPSGTFKQFLSRLKDGTAFDRI